METDVISWLLNLDADHEMRKPLGYQPNAKILQRIQEMLPLIEQLVGEDDHVVGQGVPPRPTVGLCWCPTPTALALLAKRGLPAAPCPSFEIVQKVNHRRFCFELGAALPGTAWLEDRTAIETALADKKGAWVLKRPHSLAGSGRRIVRDGHLNAGDQRWIEASVRHSGVVLEPWVETVGELVAHGYLGRGGEVTLGDVCVQRVDRHGRWLGTEVNPSIPVSDRESMHASARNVAMALAREGYFGPFGIDGYRYRDGHEVRLNPLSEINARYTTGWAVGMGTRRPDREACSRWLESA